MLLNLELLKGLLCEKSGQKFDSLFLLLETIQLLKVCASRLFLFLGGGAQKSLPLRHTLLKKRALSFWRERSRIKIWLERLGKNKANFLSYPFFSGWDLSDSWRKSRLDNEFPRFFSRSTPSIWLKIRREEKWRRGQNSAKLNKNKFKSITIDDTFLRCEWRSMAHIFLSSLTWKTGFFLSLTWAHFSTKWLVAKSIHFQIPAEPCKLQIAFWWRLNSCEYRFCSLLSFKFTNLSKSQKHNQSFLRQIICRFDATEESENFWLIFEFWRAKLKISAVFNQNNEWAKLNWVWNWLWKPSQQELRRRERHYISRFFKIELLFRNLMKISVKIK